MHKPLEVIESKIYIIRGKKVMLDADLASLYEVSTHHLNWSVKRNIERFPRDFMFRLTAEEYKSLISQIAISNKGRGGRRFLPYAFTEQGVAMLSAVLNSRTAIEVSIRIIRVFIRLRELIASNEMLRQKIEELERKFGKYDNQIELIFEAIKELLETPIPAKKPIGFHT